jgi:succinyl-CoA synthetase alpha subunit
LVRKIVVRRNRYFDSVFLMQVARRMAEQPGVHDASAVLGTEANKRLLAEIGYGAGEQAGELAAAGPNDLVIALEGDEAAVGAVASNPDSWLSRPPSGSPGKNAGAAEPRSLPEAVALRPDCGIAVISVPGEYAAREARLALNEGLNVFLFSSNVSVQDELALKTEAQKKGLIVMGPDCGTAYLSGAGIGFANLVRRGPIGIIGSTGTGMQELSCLVHQAGSGISHGIGTGSRDLSDVIGGISTMTAIDALESDQATKVITILSKPPGAATTDRLMDRLLKCSKPVVVCLLGSDAAHSARNVRSAATIDEAVAAALQAAGIAAPAERRHETGSLAEMAAAVLTKMRPGQRFIRGLFAGGTFCYQTQAVFRKAGLVAHSNSPIPGMRELADPRKSRGNSLVDMGAEVFVEGRPHPMIDATLRRQRLTQEGDDPTVAIALLDFILGAISSRDPVGDLLGAIRGAQEAARRRGNHLCVVASVCGTNEDAQGLLSQVRALVDAGVCVFSSNAQAGAFCREAALLLAKRGEAD